MPVTSREIPLHLATRSGQTGVAYGWAKQTVRRPLNDQSATLDRSHAAHRNDPTGTCHRCFFPVRFRFPVTLGRAGARCGLSTVSTLGPVRLSWRSRIRRMPASAPDMRPANSRAFRHASRPRTHRGQPDPETCRGNGKPGSAARPISAVHSRVCGERCRARRLIVVVQRFIPACASSTSALSTVHPRVCGERPEVPIHLRLVGGSSPRVRGTVL